MKKWLMFVILIICIIIACILLGPYLITQRGGDAVQPNRMAVNIVKNSNGYNILIVNVGDFQDSNGTRPGYPIQYNGSNLVWSIINLDNNSLLETGKLFYNGSDVIYYDNNMNDILDVGDVICISSSIHEYSNCVFILQEERINIIYEAFPN